MEEKFTATIGERIVVISIEEWPQIAADATKRGQKAYLVDNIDKRVIAEA